MAPQPPLAIIRAVNRLAAPSILDAVVVGRRDRDFYDALILLAVTQANVGALMRDRDSQLAFASLDAPPPDELRRPVSMQAIAHSLRLPYETVRRRLLRLARSGVCEIGSEGVIVPAREVATPEHMAALVAIWRQIQQLYCRLRDLGLLDALVPPEMREGRSAEIEPLRAAIRLASDYMLRVVDNITSRFDGLIAGLIWFAVMSANREHLDALDNDSEPRPATVTEIARRLAAPPETVRRYANGLIDAGLCQRQRRGLIVPPEVLNRPDALLLMQSNFTDLHRMFTGFAQLGVFAEWDRQSPPLRGAA